VKSARYIRAILGFGGLMAAGVFFGNWLTSGRADVLPQNLTTTVGTDDRVRLAIVADPGEPGPRSSQVRDAVADWCSANACDGVILLGDLRPPFGPEDPQDPALTEQIAPYARIAPTYLLAGDRDHGVDRKPVRNLVRWATAQANVHMPSPTWAGAFGPATVVGADSHSQGNPSPQQAWVDGQIRTSALPWLVIATHTEAAARSLSACGRAQIVLHADGPRGWTEDCGVAWVGLGDGAAGDTSRTFADEQAGSAIADPTRDAATPTFVGTAGRGGFAATRDRRG